MFNGCNKSDKNDDDNNNNETKSMKVNLLRKIGLICDLIDFLSQITRTVGGASLPLDLT